MTPTERAKRSDALYYETVSVTRRVLCDMIANRESDIDDLRNLVRDALACVRESSRVHDAPKDVPRPEKQGEEAGGGRVSMIGSLIDELNKSADEWNGSNMFELARMCRDAADTIWQLRDDLQRANAENAKLRELVRDMWLDLHKQLTPPWSGEYKQRMRELRVEADK